MFSKDWLTTMDAMQREMERLLDDFSRRKPPPAQFAPHSWAPAVDIYESQDKITAFVELCGINDEDIELVIDSHNMIIRGTRKSRSYEEVGACHQLEIYWGPFERILSLPSPVNAEAVQASVKNGILEVVMPKVQRNLGRQIRITRIRYS